MTTHIITVHTDYKYLHGEPQQQAHHIVVRGDGDLDHYLHAFRTALVAAGFDLETAARLDIKDSE